MDSTIIATLRQLSNGNDSLLVDFWILRAHIMKEERNERAAFQTFMEAVQWDPRNVGTWVRLVEMFVKENELFKATFFLQQAQGIHPSDTHLRELMEQLKARLQVRLDHPPGIEGEPGMESTSSPVPRHERPQESGASRKKTKPVKQPVTGTGDEATRRREEGVD
ncbi:MAG: tetratricopeptide repeat protein [Candidatus Thorarchaeota archaeon]